MPPSSSPEHDSTQIGPYRTLRELGRGGQAVVWLALDSRIGRQVALKVLPPLGPGGEEAMRRFRREAEVSSRLEHPAICGVLEADFDRGTPYIAMRYVPGVTLARQLAAAQEARDPAPGVQELRRLAHFVEKCARALHLAHGLGVIHRDIKPGNLMVTEEGEPVILDFGLARDEEGAGAALSVSGEVSGTPAYMSPEQMTGRARADRRSDVWSLGIVLHEAATGVHPFACATREGLFQAILHDEPQDARSANPAIDRDLATILETATAKEPDRRYQTAMDFALDLQRWRENEPIRARPVSRVERAARWMQRKPALAASLSAILLLVLSSIGLLSYGLGASGRAEVEAVLRAAAEEARETADSERARAEAARAALEQVRADQVLAAELDEISMLMGTLWFGLGDAKSIVSLRPKYLDAFRRHGFDVEQDVEGTIERLDALRARDLELANAVEFSLRNLASIRGDTSGADSPQPTPGLIRILASFPAGQWPELDAADGRWRAEQTDDFSPLLTEEALAGKSAALLFDLAGTLLAVPERLSDAGRMLDRSLALDPGSFKGHYLRAALGFMELFQERERTPEETRVISAGIVHHMQVAEALRPRSGFVRAVLASGYALNQQYAEAGRSIDAAIALEPDNAQVWFLRARFFSYTPSPNVAIQACRRALELDPSLDAAREMLAALEARAK